ncbi:MAG: hypothetical protein EZS28_046204, partial [Streblomastix strix]
MIPVNQFTNIQAWFGPTGNIVFDKKQDQLQKEQERIMIEKKVKRAQEELEMELALEIQDSTEAQLAWRKNTIMGEFHQHQLKAEIPIEIREGAGIEGGTRINIQKRKNKDEKEKEEMKEKEKGRLNSKQKSGKTGILKKEGQIEENLDNLGNKTKKIDSKSGVLKRKQSLKTIGASGKSIE